MYETIIFPIENVVLAMQKDIMIFFISIQKRCCEHVWEKYENIADDLLEMGTKICRVLAKTSSRKPIQNLMVKNVAHVAEERPLIRAGHDCQPGDYKGVTSKASQPAKPASKASQQAIKKDKNDTKITKIKRQLS